MILPPDGAEEARRAAGDRMPSSRQIGRRRVHLVAQPCHDSGLRYRDAAVFSSLPLTTSRWCCIPAGVRAGRARPLSHANMTISAANIARCYALGPDDVAMCVMPLFHVHGLVASTLATLFPAARSLSARDSIRCRSGAWPGIWHDVVFRRADAPPAAAGARRDRPPPTGGHREASLHPFVQRVAAAAGDACA